MQPMIGKDAVLLLINHRIAVAMSDMKLGNSNKVALAAQVSVLEELKAQLDFIIPIVIDNKPTFIIS